MPSWQSPLQAKYSQVLTLQNLPLCSFAVNIFLNPHFPATNDSVSVPTGFPFPECLTNGIIQYVPFVSGFVHLAQCMRFIHVITVSQAVHLLLSSIPLYGYTSLFIQ